MKFKYILLTILCTLGLTLQSCSDNEGEEAGSEQLHNPGDAVAGAVGCSASQKQDIENIPGMGQIASTTLGEDGSYIYSDSAGNTCTLDKEGNIEMNGTDGSSVKRDHTVTQSNSAQATELTGKVMTATTECPYSSLEPEVMTFNLEVIYNYYPESRKLIDVETKSKPMSGVNETDYDSLAISFEREICLMTRIKKHKTETWSYSEVESVYTARDGYFETKEMGWLHLKVENDEWISLWFADAELNLVTNEIEYRDRELWQTPTVYNPYRTAKNTDFKYNYEYKLNPSKGEYFNYIILDNGNVILTNKKKAVVLERESRNYYEDREEDVKYEFVRPSDEKDEDDEDEIIVAPPAPSIE